jgi:hypothetical protein
VYYFVAIAQVSLEEGVSHGSATLICLDFQCMNSFQISEDPSTGPILSQLNPIHNINLVTLRSILVWPPTHASDKLTLKNADIHSLSSKSEEHFGVRPLLSVIVAQQWEPAVIVNAIIIIVIHIVNHIVIHLVIIPIVVVPTVIFIVIPMALPSPGWNFFVSTISVKSSRPQEDR